MSKRAEKPCGNCGYDLRGLPMGRPCPECGEKQGSAYSSAPQLSGAKDVSLSQMPEHLVRRIAFCCAALFLAVALIVIGPKKLPDIAKAMGRAMGEFKRATNDFKSTINLDDPIDIPHTPVSRPEIIGSNEKPEAGESVNGDGPYNELNQQSDAESETAVDKDDVEGKADNE